MLYAMARVQLEGTDLFPPCYAVCMHVVLLYPAYVYWVPTLFFLCSGFRLGNKLTMIMPPTLTHFRHGLNHHEYN